MLENQVKFVYLGLGSNLGNKKRNIEKAKFMLIQKNIKLIKCSNYYESLSWPNPKNPKFLNIVIKIATSYNPSELLDICKSIEINLGRITRKRNSPRECDIDIIDYANEMLNKNIILPHPRMHIRNFVLLPLFELNKAWIHPVLRHNIKSLILSLPNKDIRSIKQI